MSVYQKIIKYLHTQKKKLDPLTMYMLMLNKDYFYYYCLFHPEVFTDNELYQQFIRLYVLNHSFRRETIDYYHGGQSADFDFNLNNHLRDKLNYNYNRIRNNRDINHNINIELNIQKEQNEDQKNLFDKYKNHHEKNLENIPEDTGHEDIDDLSKVQEILDKYNKKLDKLEKKVNKDLENRVDWTQERMKQKNRSKFKIWLQTPNPQTRHTSNDGQIVPLDEKFIIVNDKTGDIDYLDYPGDSHGSIGNIANCLCTIGFDKDITPEQLKKYKDYEKTRKQQKDKSEKIKKENEKHKKERRAQLKQKRVLSLYPRKEQEKIKKQNAEEIKKKIMNHIKINKNLYNKDKYKNAKTPEEIAKVFGYEIINDKNNYHFRDSNNNTEIIISKNYLKLNKLKGGYTIKELVKFYAEAPPKLKKLTPKIVFENKPHPEDNKNIETTGCTELKFNPNDRTVHIYPLARDMGRGERANLRETLLHEMGHVLDMKDASESQILEVINGGTKLHLSGDKEWIDIIKEEGFSSERSVKRKEYHEEFAESVGMLSHIIVEDKSTAVMVLNGEKISLDTWIDRNPKKAEYICKHLF